MLPGGRRRALHLDGAPDCSHGTREGCHQTIARRPDLTAAVRGNRSSQRREMLTTHGTGGLVAAAVELRGQADELGEQDRRELLLHGGTIIAA
jgi:hypothetical protein